MTTPSTGLFEVTADVDSVIYDGNNQIPTVTVKTEIKSLSQEQIMSLLMYLVMTLQQDHLREQSLLKPENMY